MKICTADSRGLGAVFGLSNVFGSVKMESWRPAAAVTRKALQGTGTAAKSLAATSLFFKLHFWRILVQTLPYALPEFLRDGGVLNVVAGNRGKWCISTSCGAP
jgi:hypothetical protein